MTIEIQDSATKLIYQKEKNVANRVCLKPTYFLKMHGLEFSEQQAFSGHDVDV